MTTLPDDRMQVNRRGWSRDTHRQQLFTFTEAERYERLVEIEGERVFIQFGRISSQFRQITGELIGIAYPADSNRKELVCELVIRDDEGCWRTIKSSQVRTIEVVDG